MKPKPIGTLVQELVRACQDAGDAGIIVAVRLPETGGSADIAPGGTIIVTWGELAGLRHRIDEAVRQHGKGSVRIHADPERD